MLHLRATRFHLFRSCAIQMFSVATCFLCRIDNCDLCVVCFAFVRFKCHGCATFLSIHLQVLEFHQAWMDWWWFADSKVKIQDEGARTTRPRSRLWCGVTEACYCEKACVCACFVVTGIFYVHISEIGVLVEFEVKSEFEGVRSLQGNATFSFYNNS